MIFKALPTFLWRQEKINVKISQIGLTANLYRGEIMPKYGLLRVGSPLFQRGFCCTHLSWAYLREKITEDFLQATPKPVATHQTLTWGCMYRILGQIIIPAQKNLSFPQITLYHIPSCKCSQRFLSFLHFPFKGVMVPSVSPNTMLTTGVNQWNPIWTWIITLDVVYPFPSFTTILIIQSKYKNPGPIVAHI